MTYLELVNNVLRRMREDQVSTIYENEQSTVVADFINDAKRQVEESHDWSVLFTDYAFNTGQGTKTYSLTGSQNRATIVDIRDLTTGGFVKYVPSAWIRQNEMVNNAGEANPTKWSYDGVDANGDTQIEFWPIPDGIYSMSVRMVQRTADLTADGSTTSLPHMPIIHMAHVFAATERGGVDSSDISILSGQANKALNDAIQYDMARQPERSIWMPA